MSAHDRRYTAVVARCLTTNHGHDRHGTAVGAIAGGGVRAGNAIAIATVDATTRRVGHGTATFARQAGPAHATRTDAQGRAASDATMVGRIKAKKKSPRSEKYRARRHGADDAGSCGGTSPSFDMDAGHVARQ
jgi:hypothetical protein